MNTGYFFLGLQTGAILGVGITLVALCAYVSLLLWAQRHYRGRHYKK